MDKRKIRDYKRFTTSVLLFTIYLPHILIFSIGGGKIRQDVERMLTRVPIRLNCFWGFLFLIHTNAYFRSLFYYRIGPLWEMLIGWWRPGDKYFTISKTLKMEGGVLLAHPYATILNADKIGKNFNFRHLTTLGGKNGGRPKIGDNVTLGAAVTIIGPVKIGNNVTVGAGSVVVKDVEDNCIVAGNPAKIIRRL